MITNIMSFIAILLICFNRDVDQMSDDLSEGHEENLIDDEVSFFAKSVDEIARITTRMTSSSPYLRPLSSTSVQTIDSDTSIDTSVSKKSSASRTEPTYIEELIPAEGDDPKFDIPPESVTIKEGEPAKFSCRVSGTEPIGMLLLRTSGHILLHRNVDNYPLIYSHNVIIYLLDSKMSGVNCSKFYRKPKTHFNFLQVFSLTKKTVSLIQ